MNAYKQESLIEIIAFFFDRHMKFLLELNFST